MKYSLLYIILFCCAILVAHHSKSDSIKKHSTESGILIQKDKSSIDIQPPAIPDENIVFADEETNNDDNFGTQKLKFISHKAPFFGFGFKPNPTIKCGLRCQVRDILKVNKPIYILLHQLLIHFTI